MVVAGPAPTLARSAPAVDSHLPAPALAAAPPAVAVPPAAAVAGPPAAVVTAPPAAAVPPKEIKKRGPRGPYKKRKSENTATAAQVLATPSSETSGNKQAY